MWTLEYSTQFKKDLKKIKHQPAKLQALSFTEPDYEQLRKEYKRHVDEFIDKEKETTAYLDKAQPTLQYPTVADLRKEEHEQYDATKVLTYAFRRTDDLRKGKAIPFSNMKQGYPFRIGETPFHTSEWKFRSKVTPLFSFQRDPLFRLKMTPWS